MQVLFFEGRGQCLARYAAGKHSRVDLLFLLEPLQWAQDVLRCEVLLKVEPEVDEGNEREGGVRVPTKDVQREDLRYR